MRTLRLMLSMVVVGVFAAACGGGGGGGGPAAEPSAVPEVTNFEIWRRGKRRIGMTWELSDAGVTGVEIQRAQTGALKWQKVADVAPDRLRHINAGLEPETLYAYRARCYDDAQTYAWSQVISGETRKLTVPDSPGDLDAQPFSTKQILVTWADRSTDEQRFIVERRLEPDGAWKHRATVGPDVERIIDFAQRSDVVFSYRVRAENDAGESEVASDKDDPEEDNGLVSSTDKPDPELAYELDLPTTSSTGDYDVVVREVGPDNFSVHKLLESTSPDFDQDLVGHDLYGSGEITFSVMGKAPGTYYYKAGQLGVFSDVRAIAVTAPANIGPVDVVLYVAEDNTTWNFDPASDDLDGVRSTVFKNASLAVGNEFLAGSIYQVIERRSFLRFDLSEVAGKGTVTSAKLRLWVKLLPGDWGTQYKCAACAENWDTNTITGANAGDYLGSSMSTAVAHKSYKTPPTSAVVPYEFDVTGIVANWASGTWPNYGFMLNEEITGYPSDYSLRTTHFYSREDNAGPGTQPQLLITYDPK